MLRRIPASDISTRALVTALSMTLFSACQSRGTSAPLASDANPDGSTHPDLPPVSTDAVADAPAPDPGDAAPANDGAAETHADGLDDAVGQVASDAADEVEDLCGPSPPPGYHTIHFRYLWAGPHTFTLFPKPEVMPQIMEFKLPVRCNSVICTREQDRPWFNCPVPDSYFAADVGWVMSDQVQSDWTTATERPMPGVPKDTWLRWRHGLPTSPTTPSGFEFLDTYPDRDMSRWAASGPWNDSMCAQDSGADPAPIGFGQGGWFGTRPPAPYAHGASLANAYPNPAQAQTAVDRMVHERYQLWKEHAIRYDGEACGTGTARVADDIAGGTFSPQHGMGVAMAAAMGDRDLFDRLWRFVRHYRSQAKYGGLMGWRWQSPTDCQPIDSFATSGGDRDSAFAGDLDIGMGLVYASRQWPGYAEAAADWLVRMEGEVNVRAGDGFNHPTLGDAWNKTCPATGPCDHAAGAISQVALGDQAPGYFRVFGDFLAGQRGAQATARNGQTHHDFWYRTAETVYEWVERCYDQTTVHPGLVAPAGDIRRPCGEHTGGGPLTWLPALWRLGMDAAWFGHRTDLPENAAGSSTHFPGKSRMRAKIDQARDFFAGFHAKNPPEPNANRFSSLCSLLTPDGKVEHCDATRGHDSSTVNLAASLFVSAFDEGAAAASLRREALEEALTATFLNQHLAEETIGVYSLLFLTGNFPNPMPTGDVK